MLLSENKYDDDDDDLLKDTFSEMNHIKSLTHGLSLYGVIENVLSCV